MRETYMKAAHHVLMYPEQFELSLPVHDYYDHIL